MHLIIIILNIQANAHSILACWSNAKVDTKRLIQQFVLQIAEHLFLWQFCSSGQGNQ